jgi:FkbM family methyltransferase
MGASYVMNRTKALADQTEWGREVARWATRASKGKALFEGRLKGLRVKITPEISILLPLAAHARYWAGLHEDTKSLAFLAESIPPDGVLFDVGANIGVYLSALHAWKGPGLKSVAFEPIPTTLAILQQTLDLNGVPAHIEPIALSSTEGELLLSAYSRGMSNFWIKEDMGEHPCISVRTRPLDRWLCDHPELEPDAIKIDVEGHELEVLEGAAVLLARKRPALMVECHGAAWDELGVPRARFGELLTDVGYRDLRFSDGRAADFMSLRDTAHLFAT